MAHLALLLFLFLISGATANAALSTATRIPLTKSPNHPSAPHSSWEAISLAARTSLNRARRLKRRHPTITEDVKLPAYPRSYGGYSISLSLGTPPQRVSLVLDTGSSLVWTPCSTSHTAYSCLNCTFSGVDPATVPIYKTNASSSARLVPCRGPQCGWVFGSGFKCPQCNPKHSNCTAQRCPAYGLEYGLGSTAGLLVSDGLKLSNRPGNDVPGFLFGCSLLSQRQPEGIAGFGRGLDSLPAQLGLSKFSYCLVSHRFDDSAQSGDLILYGGGRGGGDVGRGTDGIRYAPFRKSPAVSPYKEYYYVALSGITVGGKIVRLPSRYLVASPKGNGGVIVDSGSTFTFMERAIYNPVARELEKQMSQYKRAKDEEEQSGLGPCYDITGQTDVEVPKMAIVFDGGAKMDLPLANYFSFVGGPSVVCMIVMTDPEGPVGPGVPSGPAMIMGNYQQQNFYVEYDLEKQRFGFKPQQCDQSGH